MEGLLFSWRNRLIWCVDSLTVASCKKLTANRQVIVDHALKGSPPGSYSWTYIEDTIKTGTVVDPEEHRAGPAVGTSRAVGSFVPGKKGRTPFTAEDDRLLAEYITRSEKKGVHVKGNAVYEGFEKLYPHHTFHSWRDRWVKTLQYRPRPDISSASENRPLAQPWPLEGIQPSRDTQPENGKPSRPRPPKEKKPNQPQLLGELSASASLAPEQPPPTFDVTAFESLLDVYDDILNIDENNEDAAWKLWAKKVRIEMKRPHPERTYGPALSLIVRHTFSIPFQFLSTNLPTATAMYSA